MLICVAGFASMFKGYEYCWVAIASVRRYRAFAYASGSFSELLTKRTNWHIGAKVNGRRKRPCKSFVKARWHVAARFTKDLWRSRNPTLRQPSAVPISIFGFATTPAP
jgi:hypothetical protein